MRAWLALAVLVPVGIAAQERGQAKGPEEAARLHVVPATVPISLDARLDGPAWAHADSITDFRQREPSAGAPANQRSMAEELPSELQPPNPLGCHRLLAHRRPASHLRPSTNSAP